MKKIKYFYIALILLLPLLTFSQDIKSNLNNAENSYSSDNVMEARDHLQTALIELNNIVGKKILEQLPISMNGYSFQSENDLIVGGAGFAELLVGREYGNDEKSINITISTDSPILAATNAFLNNKMMSSVMGAQLGKENISVDGFKGMLEISEEELLVTINIPIGDSLFTFESTGFDRDEAINMVNTCDLNKIAELIK